MNPVLVWGGAGLGALGGVLFLVWLLQRSRIYYPNRDVPPPSAVGLDGVEAVRFPTEDGLTLGSWFVPTGSPGAARATVIVFNGNAGNRSFRAPLAARLRASGLQVLLFDYRGYGENQGRPSEEGLAADARAVRTYLDSRPDVDPTRLVYLGESLGAAVATRLAVVHPPAALILRSPFTSLADAGQRHYPFLPVRWLLRDRYPSVDIIGLVRCPVLIIAGTEDDIVPMTLSRRLHAAVRAPRRFVEIPDTGHNASAILAGDAVVTAIVEFIGSALAEGP